MTFQDPNRNRAMPYLAVDGAADVVAFVQAVFGAQLPWEPLRHDDGSIWYAECHIGDSTVMVAEARGFGPYPGFVYLYVEDCDATYEKALAHGAESFMPPADQFFGDRTAGVRDNAGNIWWMATHQQDLTESELHARAEVEKTARRRTQ